MLSYDTLNIVFKIHFNYFPKYVFKQLGDLGFLLKCNYSIEKIPVKLAKFHKQAFMAYKHNFSPKRYHIWNNKNKSLYFDYWFETKSASQEKDLNIEEIKSKILIGNTNIIQNRLK